MKKLVVTCDCGQRMQVPRSAIGRMGMCPTCGRTMLISNDNASPASDNHSRGSFFSARTTSWWRNAMGMGSSASPNEEAKRRFGEAVDLYYQKNYGEALAIFDDLARRYPGNGDIERARRECLAALRRPSGLAIENRSGVADRPEDISASAARPPVGDAELNAETVKRVVLEKLLYSPSETVQLHAAELACRMLGLFVQDAPQPGATPKPDVSGNGRHDSEENLSVAPEEPTREAPPSMVDL